VKSAYDLAAAAVPKSTVTTAGDVIYATGSAAVTRLALGTAGKVLTVNAGATAPEWATAATGLATTAWSAYTFGSSTVIGTAPRQSFFTSTSAVVQGTDLVLTRLIAPYNFTVTNLSFTCESAGTGMNFARFGIYTRSGTTFTLVARTANDASMFTSADTKYTRALNTTGGYPATYSMTAGSEYWIAVLVNCSGGGPRIIQSTNFSSNATTATVGAERYLVSGQSDLPTSATGTAVTSTRILYAEVS
jgi:hypothetical protein